ncbi:MAG: hypothetical protein US76_01000 [Parcubacteria group bacterium GW2011_GWA2_38_13b]|nr:MAG: hypothetical protein US76_01000 [Parcubacteria group bacterium GW2011_GWA2_38_13b]
MNQNNENNKEIDLSYALNDSGSRVKFESEQQYARPYYSDTPKIIQMVMKYSGGYIKDEKRAGYVLFGFIAVVIIISLFFIFGGGGNERSSGPPTPLQLREGKF